jgi:hypothetical protein
MGNATTFSGDGTRFASVVNDVDGDEPVINLLVYGDDGRQRFSRSWPLPRIAITERMIDSALDSDRRREEAMYAGSAELSRLARRQPPSTTARLESEVRKRIPRFASGSLTLAFTGDGHLWVALPRPGTTIDVLLLDAAGRTVLSGSLPHGQRLISGTRTTVWTMSHDSDDLAVLTRYRVR